jgi:signal peptidase I
VIWRARASAGAVLVASALCGCGGSGSGSGPSDASKIQAAVADYFAAISNHDASAVCRLQTSGYWNATRVEANSRLQATGRPALPADCRAGFAKLFALNGTSVPPAKVTVTDVSVNGDAASGTLVSGARRQAARFVRAGSGQWQISCCTGSQVTAQAQSTFKNPSGGMLPTLKVGQLLTVDDRAFASHAPQLGQIVLFHPPSSANAFTHQCANPKQGSGHRQACAAVGAQPSTALFIKRIVGLPGDRIAIVGGKVERNGQLQTEPYAGPCTDQLACNLRTPVTVPPNSYYMLGDNRGASDDSRFWGPVKRSWIIGLVNAPH